MNILVATPGRLLQHMDETPYFDCSSLSMLVLDEADRVLDMARCAALVPCCAKRADVALSPRAAQGFSATLNAIVANLPRERQTLLFSATQTRKVADLARLSLRDPEYVAVHENATSATPPRLTQLVATVALPDKLHAVWGFVKTHLTSKTLIFFSSCRQVAFVHEALRQLRPGVPLRALHGRMKQSRRMTAFYDFCAAPAMVMLATDIAARGLDFPSVDWVLQADAPEDVAAYIHRVGRTARYTSAGKSLLLLLPSEAALLPQLAAAKAVLSPTALNLARTPTVTPALAGLLSQDAALKAQAQKAVVSYLKSVYLQPNKAVFDVTQLPVAAYAASLGLTTTPRLRFVARDRGGNFAQAQAGGDEGGDTGDEEDEDEDDEDAQPRARRPAARPPAEEPEEDDGGGSDSELMAVKRKNHVLPGEADPEPAPELADGVVAVAAKAKKPPRLRIRSGGTAGNARGTKVVFDADGTPRLPLEAMAMREAEAEPERPRCVPCDCFLVSRPAHRSRHMRIAAVRQKITARPWRRVTPPPRRSARSATPTTSAVSASFAAKRSGRAKTSCARAPSAPRAAAAAAAFCLTAGAAATRRTTTAAAAVARRKPSRRSRGRSAPSARRRMLAWARSAWRSWKPERWLGWRSAEDVMGGIVTTR